MSNTGFNQVFDSFGTMGFGNGFSYTLSSSSPPPVTSSLILDYDFSNVSCYVGSGSAVTDLMGNSNATLYNGPTYSSGYLVFDGTNDALITNTSLASKVTSDITSISMWAYPMDNGVLLSEIGSNALPSAAGWHNATMEMVAGTMKFGMWNGGSISSVTSTIATPLNNWYHFTIVYDGTTLRGYVNGAAAGTNTFSRTNPVEGAFGIHYAIAAADITSMGDGTYASMRLGELKVYNTAMSAAEVSSSYEDTKSKWPNPP